MTLEQIKNLPREAVDAALWSYMAEFPKGQQVEDGDTHVEIVLDPAYGKIAPPRHLIAYCEPAALDGTVASLRKLCESRGWISLGEIIVRPDAEWEPVRA